MPLLLLLLLLITSMLSYWINILSRTLPLPIKILFLTEFFHLAAETGSSKIWQLVKYALEISVKVLWHSQALALLITKTCFQYHRLYMAPYVCWRQRLIYVMLIFHGYRGLCQIPPLDWRLGKNSLELTGNLGNFDGTYNIRNNCGVLSPWKNRISFTCMKLRKSLVKPMTRQSISSCSVLSPEIVMHDAFSVILWTSTDICVVVHDDLGWKNRTTHCNRFWRAGCSRLEYVDIRLVY